MDKAKEQIDHIDLELRDVTSMTMPIDKNKIKQAKEMIFDFRRKLTNYLESGEKDEVYSLNIQLIPLTEPRELN